MLFLHIFALLFILVFATQLSDGTADCFFQATAPQAPDSPRQETNQQPIPDVQNDAE